jgi:hypothetical protein
MLSAVTDGIIVGSAIIKLIEAHTIKQDNDLQAGPDLVKKVGEFIGELKEATIIMDFHSDKYGTSMRSFLDLRYSYVYQNGHHNDRNDIPQKKC